MVAPDPEQPWRPNYGLWVDEAEALGVSDYLEVCWPEARVELARGPRILARPYGLLDDRRLQLEWLAECRARGVVIKKGRVRAIEHGAHGSTLILGEGRLSAKLIVDASGHGSPFIVRESGRAPGFQIAWGELWAVDSKAVVQGEAPSERTATFMDWRPVGSSPPGSSSPSLPPTFCYRLPLGPDRVFLEETVLVTRPPPGVEPADYFEALRERLARRIAAKGGLRGSGLLGARPLETERCIIPMGGPLPLGSQRLLGFGGAAGMVHPATGYMFTQVLRMRGPVAAQIARELGDWGDPGAASRRVWSVIWPRERVRIWRLYTFGMDALAEMELASIDAFFDNFFALDPTHWRRFISAEVSPGALMSTMLRYFGSAPLGIKGRLAGALMGGPGLRMARGFSGLDQGRGPRTEDRGQRTED